jgi:N-methylhydantoinase A
MHCAFYGAECGAREVIIPMRAGTFSALGVATAPLLHTARAATFMPMPMDAAAFSASLRELDATVVAALDSDGVAEQHREISYLLEMRYGAQVHTVRIKIPRQESFDDAAVAQVSELFDATYDRHYGAGSGYPAAGRFLTTFIVEGRGNLPAPSAEPPARVTAWDAADHALIGRRDAHFDGAFTPTNIYRYESLRPGDAVEGPAIVEAAQTTAVIRRARPPPSTSTTTSVSAACGRQTSPPAS